MDKTNYTLNKKNLVLKVAYATKERGSTDKCMHCGKLGHWKQDCPIKHKLVKEMKKKYQ